MAEIRDDTIDNVVVDTAPQDNIVDNTELDRVNVGETQYIVKNLDLNSLEFAPSDGEFVYNQNKAIYSGIFTYTVEGQTTPKQASGEIVLNISSGNGISISEDLTDSNLVISLNAETISAIESISTLQADISALQSGKVDKVQGKGLSTNDYTTEEKNKLASITPQNYSLITETGSIITLEINSSTYEITAKLKDKNGNVISTSQSIDLPLESVVVSGRYDATNQKIVLELENGNTIDVPVGALVSGLQSEITSTNKLDADLVDDTTSANKFVSTQEKSTWSGKQDAINDLSTIRSGASAGATAVQDANYVHTDNNYTSEDKTKVANALTSETDPTVPNWAKQPTKPTYDYSEITNTPTIPTVNNPTITITQGGVTKGSFTLNQATGDTIALDAGGQQNVVSDAQVDDVSVVSNSVAKIYTINNDYDASTNKLATENDLPDISDVVVHDDTVTTANESTFADNYYTKTQIIDLIYPIGSVFITVNNVNPKTYLPNTNWELIEDRFLLGAGSTYTAGATGGSENHTHTLDDGYAQIAYTWQDSQNRLGLNRKQVNSWYMTRYTKTSGVGFEDGSKIAYDAAQLAGSTDSSSNMPPYLVVYMWKRIPLANS